jgi:hypothetical protein
MKHKTPISRIIDILGKCLLGWFVFQTLQYFWTGLFLKEIEMVPYLFNGNFTWIGLYSLLSIPVAALGAFVLIPLLLRGYLSGLLVGLLYCAMGYFVNPLWFIVPIAPSGEGTSLLWGINLFWSGFTLAIIFCFYYVRRPFRKPQSHNV